MSSVNILLMDKPWRIVVDDTVLILADLQEDFAGLPLTIPFDRLKRNVAALVRLASIFDIPVIVTAVPAGNDGSFKLIREIEDDRRAASVFVRTASNGFDDEALRAAIEGCGRKTILVSGIVTEVAVQSFSLTAVSKGFDVEIVVDGCAGLSERTEAAAFMRLVQAGARMSSVPALVGQLAGDFSQTKGRQAIEVLSEIGGVGAARINAQTHP